MDFGNMDVCADYVSGTVIPGLQREIPGLQTVHLSGTNLAVVNFGETKRYEGTEFVGILIKVLPYKSHRGPNPVISGEFLSGDLQNPDFRFGWTLENIVRRIKDFHNQ